MTLQYLFKLSNFQLYFVALSLRKYSNKMIHIHDNFIINLSLKELGVC